MHRLRTSLALVCSLLVSRLALAQTDPSPGSAPPDPGAPTTPPTAVAPSSPPTITVTEDQLDKLIDARIAAERAAAPSPVPPPAPPKDAEPAEASAPFAFGDFSWMPGNYGSSERPLSAGPFTGELRVDTSYNYDFSHPKDDTISGSSEVFRSNEIQVTHIGLGGDFLYKGLQARLMTQFGMYSTTTPRNDASPGRGQWDLADAYRYVSEAYGGYHIPIWHGINVQAGIFMSYIGLWSYYNFDNWTYQPSYVSSNTPWFFDGARIQIFPSDKLKIEPWLVNGWQSYGKFNQAPGVGVQIAWRPTEWVAFVGNQYFGTDTLNTPGRKRLHSDDSVMFRLYKDPNANAAFSQAAASLTMDAGCEVGNGNDALGIPKVSCTDQYFLGFMAYARLWFWGNHLGTTVGGGAITNPGRYLVLVPPINGATAFSGTPYFTANPGDEFNAWDMQITEDYMPTQFVTFRAEYNHRAASVPYFTGPGGVTPPGGNSGAAGSSVDGWTPDLVKTENRITFALMVKL